MTDGTVVAPQLETARFDKKQSQFVGPKIAGDGKYVGWLAPTLTWEGLTIRPQNWRLWTLANDFTIFMATGDW